MPIYPKTAHPHDHRWLHQQLRYLPIEHKKRALAGYDSVYTQARESGATEGYARRIANTRLREFVQKISNQANN